MSGSTNSKHDILLLWGRAVVSPGHLNEARGKTGYAANESCQAARNVLDLLDEQLTELGCQRDLDESAVKQFRDSLCRQSADRVERLIRSREADAIVDLRCAADDLRNWSDTKLQSSPLTALDSAVKKLHDLDRPVFGATPEVDGNPEDRPTTLIVAALALRVVNRKLAEDPEQDGHTLGFYPENQTIMWTQTWRNAIDDETALAKEAMAADKLPLSPKYQLVAAAIRDVHRLLPTANSIGSQEVRGAFGVILDEKLYQPGEDIHRGIRSTSAGRESIPTKYRPIEDRLIREFISAVRGDGAVLNDPPDNAPSVDEPLTLEATLAQCETLLTRIKSSPADVGVHEIRDLYSALLRVPGADKPPLPTWLTDQSSPFTGGTVVGPVVVSSQPTQLDVGLLGRNLEQVRNSVAAVHRWCVDRLEEEDPGRAMERRIDSSLAAMNEKLDEMAVQRDAAVEHGSKETHGETASEPRETELETEPQESRKKILSWDAEAMACAEAYKRAIDGGEWQELGQFCIDYAAEHKTTCTGSTIEKKLNQHRDKWGKNRKYFRARP